MLPPDFERLTSLQRLDLSHNKLVEAPDFSRQHRVQLLYLYNNPQLREVNLLGVLGLMQLFADKELCANENLRGDLRQLNNKHPLKKCKKIILYEVFKDAEGDDDWVAQDY